MKDNPHLEIDRRILGDAYASEESWENLRILTDEFGSRFGGTEGERRAAEFLAEKMRAYGLVNVDQEPVEYLSWQRGEASLEVLEPVRRKIPCISLPHSPARSVEAPLVDMEEGSPRDFERRAAEIDGKIVLTNSVVSMAGVHRWIHRNEKLGRSMMAGAQGFIFANHYPGYGPPTGGIGHRGRASLIPGIGLSYENGAYLQRLIRQHGQLRVRLETQDRMKSGVSWNVVGELPAQGEEIVMLGCHYDGHDISQGAQDPASGVASLLEAARLLASHAGALKSRVRIVFWGVEEIGLLGSNAYVAAHEAELDRVRFYFNLDGAGAVEEKGVVLNEWPALEPVFEGWSREMALPFQVGQSVNAHSDHFPFLLAGVPTGGMEQVRRSLSGRGYGHTAFDTLDKVDLRGLREAATLAARLALRMANTDHWPATRRSREAVQALITAPPYDEEARFREAIDAHYARARS